MSLAINQSPMIPIAMLLPNIQLGVPSTMVIILLLLTFITWNFQQGCYRTLPLRVTPFTMFNNTYNQQDCCKKNILHMDLYNSSHFNIYNDHPVGKKTSVTT